MLISGLLPLLYQLPSQKLSMTCAIEPVSHFDLDADDRALAIHEAGHAVVAQALGAEVAFVQLKMSTADGLTGLADELAQVTKKLAVCLAGSGAELIYAAARQTATKQGDYKKI